jgi:RsiW-degrading membrane proteinase PrsW (M82 family)
LALIVVLFAVSVISPVVEELSKSSAPWALYERLSNAAQGFSYGALSGAGFALFEGLIASAEPTGTWAFIFVIRGWSSLMHILASALSGWGIATYRQTGRVTSLLGGYLLAMGIHAIWNASVVAIGFGGLRLLLNDSQVDIAGMAILALGALMLMAQVMLLPLALLFVNKRLRPPQSGSALQAALADGELASRAGLKV